MSYRSKFEKDCNAIRTSYPPEYQTPVIVDARFNSIKAGNKYSQFGEDGLIAGILAIIGVKHNRCFEVGASDGEFFSNTKALRDEGWNAVLGESDRDDFEKLCECQSSKVHCVNSFIGLDKGIDYWFGGDGCYDLGVIDIDGGDAQAFERMTIRPRIMVVECCEEWGRAKGSNDIDIDRLNTLAAYKGYTLVAVTFCNAIFVANEELPAPIKQRKIIGVMSQPRFGPLGSQDCIKLNFAQFGIKTLSHTGAYWEQTLQNVLEDVIAEGHDDAIVMDYDSIFDVEQLRYMLMRWIYNPQIDALSCVQPRRGAGTPMLSGIAIEGTRNGDYVQVKTSQTGIKCATAHFGLTFIRLSKLKDVPKPWFKSTPGKNGTWRDDDEGKEDADIYFWRNWAEHGCNLHVLPEVCLGHLEEVISQHDPKTGMAKYRHIGYRADKPFDGEVIDVPPKKEKPCVLKS